MSSFARAVAKSAWRTGASATRRLRVLPDFLIIGAQKSGTTSLHNYLCGHPNVLRPTRGEVHFFDREHHRGVDWYRSHFPLRVSVRLRQRLTPGTVLAGETTPAYLPHPHAAERARQLLPGIKLIAVLRDPTFRAYSHYQHQVRLGREQRSFERAINADLDRLSRSGWEIDSARSGAWRRSYIERGLYLRQIRNWQQWYPAERCLIIPSERLFEAPAAAFEEVVDFLGLPHWRPRRFKSYNAHGTYTALGRDMERRLRNYFGPHNLQLFQHLGRSFNWP